MATEEIFTDNEEILKVFSESLQQAWRDNPDALRYLSDLSSVGLQRLHQEPDKLADEKSAILEQTQDLAFRNYKTFIQTAECSHEIFQDFNIMESKLESLLQKLPKFNEKCQEFVTQAQHINSRWHEASLTLKKHPQLLEFLEMPQLMDTYVRNAFYEEALELALYVKRLDRKHSNIPLIAGIVRSVQGTLNCMLTQLLAQLKSNIQLPACLKVIGFLRRMDVFSELELRIKFLQARGAWFQEILNEISQDDPYQHIIKVIEMSRIHLFDIVTQYRAIFSDDDPVLLTAKDGGQSETSIFQSWVALKVMAFLNILQSDLTSDLGGRIDSVYAQCMYFGLSFSRVGIDFRPLLVPLFEASVVTRFASAVSDASSTFEQTMESYTIANYNITTSSMTSSLLSDDILQPPNSLLDFHPLAQYCNNILTALNSLKLCCSFSVLVDVISNMDKSLKHVVRTIVDFFATEKSTMTESESELFIKFCTQFATELIPHLEKCLTAIFPPDELACILGITPLEFTKLEPLFTLDVTQISKPLNEILPPKDDGIIITVKESANIEETSEVEHIQENN